MEPVTLSISSAKDALALVVGLGTVLGTIAGGVAAWTAMRLSLKGLKGRVRSLEDSRKADQETRDQEAKDATEAAEKRLADLKAELKSYMNSNFARLEARIEEQTLRLYRAVYTQDDMPRFVNGGDCRTYRLECRAGLKESVEELKGMLLKFDERREASRGEIMGAVGALAREVSEMRGQLKAEA